mmetsp:Transcript_28391/g.55340  ORF Transcript_28391/g.55340 Transcript_28391/m.55340 type:complete len:229 (+) Transcript_28391:96-782(+)
MIMMGWRIFRGWGVLLSLTARLTFRGGNVCCRIIQRRESCRMHSLALTRSQCAPERRTEARLKLSVLRRWIWSLVKRTFCMRRECCLLCMRRLLAIVMTGRCLRTFQRLLWAQSTSCLTRLGAPSIPHVPCRALTRYIFKQLWYHPSFEPTCSNLLRRVTGTSSSSAPTTTPGVARSGKQLTRAGRRWGLWGMMPGERMIGLLSSLLFRVCGQTSRVRGPRTLTRRGA